MRVGTEEELAQMRPKHPDFESLRRSVVRSDDETEGMTKKEYEAYIARVSGLDIQTLGTKAMEAGIDISLIALEAMNEKRKSGKDPEEFLAKGFLTGWAAGFQEGRRASTGINYTSKESDDTLFCGVDQESYQYIAQQRVIRMLEYAVKIDRSEYKTAPQLLTGLIGSCWMDGYFAALNYERP